MTHAVAMETAGDQTVLATGGAFNVEMVGDDVLVTLLEGEVIVTDARNEEHRLTVDALGTEDMTAVPSSVKLKPGEQLLASVAAPPISTRRTPGVRAKSFLKATASMSPLRA